VSVLIDGGASHNFIDSALLQRSHIPTIEFEGVFGPIPLGVPPDRGFEHTIELEPGVQTSDHHSL
jgi:hypothetical protein